MKQRPSRKKGRRSDARRKLQGESIESRVLYSATWVGAPDDRDDPDHQHHPDAAEGDPVAQDAAVDALSHQTDDPDGVALSHVGLDDELPANADPDLVEPAATTSGSDPDDDGQAAPAADAQGDGDSHSDGNSGSASGSDGDSRSDAANPVADETVGAPPAEGHPAHEFVFLDPNVPHADQLIADITAHAGENRSIVVVMLDPDRDGIEQIGATLAENGNVAAIHIISHGGDGLVALGNTTLDQQSLDARRDEITQWGASFTENADILIYGCDVAATATGHGFVADLSSLTGADVAASNDTTGHHSLGGDWDLEDHTGNIETHLAVSASLQEQWIDVLPTYTQFTDYPSQLEIRSDANHGQLFRYNSPGGTYTVNEISLALKRSSTASAQTITVELRTSWNGTVLGSASMSSASLGTTMTFVDFHIPNVQLQDGQTYVLRVSSSSTGGKVYVGYDPGGGYIGGDRLNSNGIEQNHDDLAFKVGYGNSPPVASAGPDQTVAETAVVTLTSAGSSDPEGQALTRTWTQTSGPAVTLSSTTAVAPTFTAPNLLANTTLTFQVAVNDGSLTSYDTVSITVNADNDAPAANAGPDQTVAENAVVTLTSAGSSDPEGQGLTRTWTQTGGPAVTLSSNTAVAPTFTAPDLLANTALTFQVAVSDGTNNSFDTVTITVNADNDAPSANAGPDQTVAETAVVTLTSAGSSDPEGQGLTRTWTQTGGPAVTLSSGTAVAPTFTAPDLLANTALTFQVAVSDGTNTSFDTVIITVNADNDAPSANAGPDQSVAETAVVTLTAAGSSDPEGQGLTYTWTQVGGPAVTLSSGTAVAPTFTAPDLLANTALTFQVAVSDGTNTSFDTVIITVNADNDAPSANAGPDQTVAENTVVTLTSAGSTDPEGQGLTRTWTQIGGPAVTLSSTTAVAPTFTAPDLLANTALTFQVAVSDGTNTSFDTVIITVNADNDAPSANAGPDQTVTETTIVTLTAAGSSDPEGQGLTYTWTQTGGPAVTLSSTTAVAPAFRAPDAAGSYTLTFQVAVDDGTNTSFDTVIITVNATEDAPVASAGPDQTVAENAVVTLDASGSFEPEAQPLTYSWTQTGGPAVTLSNSTAIAPTFTAPDLVANTALTFQVAVSDGTNTSFDTVIITVNADNDAPTANAGPDQTVAETSVVTLTAGGSTDPEGQALTYTWTQTGGPAVTLSSTTAVAPTFLAPDLVATTALTFQVAVSDGTNTSFDTVIITVNADNDAPTADAGPDQTVAENDAVTLTAAGSSDPEGQSLTYTWTQVGGPAVTLSSSTAVSPTFTAPEAAGSYTLTFQVAASDGTNTSFDTVTITVNADDDAPTADAGPDQIVAETAVVTLTAGGSTDPEGQALGYTWTQTGGPAVALSSTTDVSPTFTAPNLAGGTDLTFQVAVSDGTTTSFDTVTITVNAKNDAPTVDAGPDQTVAETDVVTLTAGGSSDPEGQGITYTWTQVGGPAVTLSDTTAISPTFTAPDLLANTALAFEVAVSDGTNTSFDTVTITVNADNDAPSADAGPDQTVEETDVVTLTAAGSTDPEGQGLTYTWTQTGGPAVVLSSTTAVAPTFTAPDMVANTVLTFQVAASDGTNTSFDTVLITVNADNDAPTADAGPDQTVAENNVVTLTAAGSSDQEGQGLSYTWMQTGGPAVTLSNSTTIAPTFTAPDMAANTTLTFQVGVSDGMTTSFDTVTITVNADDDAPTANAGPDQAIAENSTVTLTAAGSSDPEGQGLSYTWTQTGGPSVMLSSTTAVSPMFTTPEAANNYTLTFQVAVSDGTTTSFDTVTIDVTASNLAPVADAGTTITVNAGDAFTLDGSTSYDPESAPLTYHWRQVSGPQLQLSASNIASPRINVPDDVSGTAIFELEVGDGLATSTDTVTVQIRAHAVPDSPPTPLPTGGGDPAPKDRDPWSPTQPPRANDDRPPTPNTDTDEEPRVVADESQAAPRVDAGLDFTVPGGTRVQLSGAVDGGGAEGVRYRWTQVSGVSVALENTQGLAASFQAPADLGSDSVVTFQFTAISEHGTSSDTVDVTIRAGAGGSGSGEEPILLAPVAAGAPVQLMVPGTQFAPGETSIEWLQLAGTPVTIGDPNSPTATFEAPRVFVGESLEFEVTTRNGTEVHRQRVHVPVDAVEVIARHDMPLASWTVGDKTVENEHSEDQPLRGIGRLWAAVAIFMTGRFQRSKTRR